MTEQQVIEVYQRSLVEMFESLKDKLEEVEVEMAVIADRMEGMENMFGSTIL